MQPHRFTLDLFLLTYIDLKKSTKDRKKWGLPCSILNEGKVFMKCSFGLAFFCLHTVHLLVMPFIDTPSLITQNLCLIADNTYSVPKWGISWFHSQEAAIYCQKVLIDALLNSRCLDICFRYLLPIWGSRFYLKICSKFLMLNPFEK